jgi:site-specific recombinase XerD
VPDRLPALIPTVDPDRINAGELGEIQPELAKDLAHGADLVRKRRANSTIRAYDSDLRVLYAYLEDRGQRPGLPVDPLLLVAFIAYEARPDERPGHERRPRASSTIDRRLAAIGKAHQLAGLPDPTKDQRVRDALTGARRALAEAPSHAKTALALEHLDHMLRPIPTDTHAGLRDRALLLVGIATTMRRSELVALDVEHIAFEPEGMLVTIGVSKTDQEGKGEVVAVAYGDRHDLCAVRALREWLDAAGIRSGAVFRRVRAHDRLTSDRLSDRAVARTVKKHAEAAGLDPEILAGHSLRSGGLSHAALEDNDERSLARLSRHRDLTVLRSYIRQATPFEDTAQVLRAKPERPTRT